MLWLGGCMSEFKFGYNRDNFWVSVVEVCPRACSTNWDRDFCFQREFAAFVGSLRLLIQNATDVPAAFEVDQILKARDMALKSVDNDKSHVLFGQYFHFDVSSEQPYFYRDVQQLLLGLCVTLSAEYLQD